MTEHDGDPAGGRGLATGGRGLAFALAAAATAVVLLPVTIVSLLQVPEIVPEPPKVVWLVVLAVVLHGVSMLAAWWPTAAFAAGALCMLAIALTPVEGFSSAALLPSSAAFLLLEWQMSARARRPLAIAALVVGLVGACIVTGVDLVVNAPDVGVLLIEILGLAAVVAAPWAFGALARSRRLASEERSAQRVRQAVAAERIRIGRDLHDVVSHSLTVMIAQAEAARVLVDEPRAGEALGRVAETGRGAMQGLRGMLRVLGDDTADRVPAPSLADLESLVRDAATGEHRTSFSVHGTPRELAPDVELALYRAVQEATTNAMRHVRPPVRILVEIEWRADEVVATVADDGGAGHVHAEDAPAAGSGLIGMAERVQRAGGTLHVRRGRGWTVTATLPLEPKEAP